MSGVINNTQPQAASWGTYFSSLPAKISSAVQTGAAKVAEFAKAAFQILSNYAGKAWDTCSYGVNYGVNAAKANPQVALGGAAAVGVVALAVVAYNKFYKTTV